jgi:hypothetical protein
VNVPDFVGRGRRRRYLGWMGVVRFLIREFQAWSTRSYNRAIQAPVIPSQAQRWMKAQGWLR